MKKIVIVVFILLPPYTTFGNEAYKSRPVAEDFLQQQEQTLKALLQKQTEEHDAFIKKQEVDRKNGAYSNRSHLEISRIQDKELHDFLQRQEDDLDAFIHKQQTERNAFFGRDTPLSCPVIDNEMQNLFDPPHLKENRPKMNEKSDTSAHYK